MTFLTEQDKKQIAEAIANAETSNSGEIVTVLINVSDDYYYIPMMWSALFALLVPATIHLMHIESLFSWQYESQLIAFVFMGFLFRWSLIKMWLVPKYVQQQHCHRLAMRQFFEQNVYDTKAHTGILFFVSVTEQYVEIIADKGINDVVETAVWENIILQFTKHIKRRKVKQGFLHAIQECEAILIQHFPADKDNTNELSNQLVELKN